jgi:O-antigen/teichoic acid export membrane protein
LRKLASDSLIYGLGSVANQALAFLLLPLYTRYLTPADYGTLALVSALGGVIALFATLGIYSGLLRIFFLYEADAERADVVSTAWAFTGVASVVVGSALFAATPALAPLVLDVEGSVVYLRYAIVLNCLQAMAATALATLQAYQRPRPYVASTIAGLVAGLFVSIYLVAVSGRGVGGVLEGQIAGTVVQLAIAVAPTLRRLRPALHGPALRQMLGFCIPLIPTNLAAWGLTLADRYFLKIYSTLTQVGLYSLGYRFGSVLDTGFIQPFTRAWFPYLFSILDDPAHPEICARVLEYYTLVGGAIVLVLSLFGGEVIRLIADPSFLGAEPIIFWIGIGTLVRGMTYITVAGIHIHRKTHYSAVLFVGGSIVNLGLLAVLVPAYGMLGAAWATILTFAGLSGGLYLIAQRLHPIPYRLDRVALLLAIVSVLGLGGQRIQVESILLACAAKLGVLALFPLIVVAIGFFRHGEIERARALLRRAAGG